MRDGSQCVLSLLRLRPERPLTACLAGTYSNVSNHPRLLRARGEGPRPVRILIDGKTGFPMVEGEEERRKVAAREAEDAEMDSDDESGEEGAFPSLPFLRRPADRLCSPEYPRPAARRDTRGTQGP